MAVWGHGGRRHPAFMLSACGRCGFGWRWRDLWQRGGLDSIEPMWAGGDGVGDFDPAASGGRGDVDQRSPISGERIQVENGVGDAW